MSSIEVSRNSHLPAFLALGCVGLFAVPAFASEAPDDAASTIVVTGHQEKAVESPKATRPLLDTPQTITVVSEQVIAKQNLLTLRDVLSTLPGITFGAGEGGGGMAIRSTCAAIRPTTMSRSMACAIVHNIVAARPSTFSRSKSIMARTAFLPARDRSAAQLIW